MKCRNPNCKFQVPKAPLLEDERQAHLRNTGVCSEKCYESLFIPGESQPDMARAELFALHHDLCNEAFEVMKAKNQDYTGGDKTDPFKNFKGSLIFDVEPEIGTMIRMNDKFQRVKAFIVNGTLVVQSESIRDIGVDLINYTVLLVGQLIARSRKPEEVEWVEVQAEGGFRLTEEDVQRVQTRLDQITVANRRGISRDINLTQIIEDVLYQSEQIEIPRSFPIPEGYAMLSREDKIRETDLTWHTSEWALVISDDWGKFVGDRPVPVIRRYKQENK